MFSLSKRYRNSNTGSSGPSEVRHSFSHLAEDFIYSGSSALLLLIANLFPHYWYFSFVALFPFLWKIRRASPGESFRLGFLLGLTFFTFWSLDAFFVAPASTILKISGGTLLFALWGWAVGSVRRFFGFNPIIVSALWVFFELGLIKLGYTSGLLTHSTPTTPFVLRLATLFGLGIISFLVVLLNSILVKAIEYALKSFKIKRLGFITSNRFCYFVEDYNLLPQRFFLIPQLRGPPIMYIID